MALSRIESPLTAYTLAEKIRTKLFAIKTSEDDHLFIEYFPKDATPEHKQAIIYIAALTGLREKNFIKEVKSIIREQGLVRKGKPISPAKIHSLLSSATSLKTGVTNLIISEEGKSHISPQSGTTRHSIIHTMKTHTPSK